MVRVLDFVGTDDVLRLTPSAGGYDMIISDSASAVITLLLLVGFVFSSYGGGRGLSEPTPASLSPRFFSNLRCFLLLCISLLMSSRLDRALE